MPVKGSITINPFYNWVVVLVEKKNREKRKNNPPHLLQSRLVHFHSQNEYFFVISAFLLTALTVRPLYTHAFSLYRGLYAYHLCLSTPL